MGQSEHDVWPSRFMYFPVAHGLQVSSAMELDEYHPVSLMEPDDTAAVIDECIERLNMGNHTRRAGNEKCRGSCRRARGE
jgi:hypothetical protein